MNHSFKRAMAWVLTASLVFNLSMSGTTVRAVGTEEEGVTPCHTAHDETCGYVEEVKGSPCSHVHDETCGYQEPTEGTACSYVHEHNAECGYSAGIEAAPCDQGCADTNGDGIVDHTSNCTYNPGATGTPCTDSHTHDESCGYQEAVSGSACNHIHDASLCGYAEAIEGQPCKHQCEECSPTETEQPDFTPSGTQIQSFEPLEKEIALQKVPAKTLESELNLPDQLAAIGADVFSDESKIQTVTSPGISITATPSGISVPVVKWELLGEKNEGVTSYDENAKTGTYIFTPVLSENYTLVEGVSLPEIVVAVQEAKALFANSPITITNGENIFANGVPIELVKGADDTKTNIVVSGAAVDLKAIDNSISGDVTNGFDLASFNIYGGVENKIGTTASIHMTGGTVTNIYGGGENLPIYGNIQVVIGGSAIVTGGVYGGGKAAVTGQNGQTSEIQVTIEGSATIGAVYGGGYLGTAQSNTNVTVKENAKIVKNVYGGGLTGPVLGNTSVSIQGGSMQNVYGGGTSAVGGVNQEAGGNTEVTVTGGTMQNVYGGGTSQIEGNTKVTINGGSIAQNVYGSGYSGTVSGNTTVAVQNGSITGNVYGGGDTGVTTGNTTVTVDNSVGGSVYGGGVSGSVSGNTTVTVNGSVGGSVYGGGEISAASVHDATVTLKDNIITGSIYAGGKAGTVLGNAAITMENGKVTNVYGGGDTGNVNGTAALTIQSGSITGSVYGAGNTGSISSATTLMIENGSIVGSVYGSGTGAKSSVDSAEITIKAGTIGKDVYGGNALTGMKMWIQDGVVIGKIYGGKTAATKAVEGESKYLINTTGTGTPARDTFTGVFMQGANGFVSGKMDLFQSVTVTGKINIEKDAVLTIPTGSALQNNGTMTTTNQKDDNAENNGKLVVEGTFTGKPIIIQAFDMKSPATNGAITYGETLPSASTGTSITWVNGEYIGSESRVERKSGANDTAPNGTPGNQANVGEFTYYIDFTAPEYFAFDTALKEDNKIVVSGDGKTLSYLYSEQVNQAKLTVSGAAIAEKTYDGETNASVTKVDFTGLKNNEEMVYGTDYTATASFDSADAGTSKTVTGTALLVSGSAIGANYTIAASQAGFTVNNQTIQPRAVSTCTIAPITGQVYTGQQLKPIVTVSYGAMSLVSGTAYTVAYGENIKAGTSGGSVTLTGMGNFTGSAITYFDIARGESNLTLTFDKESYTYGDSVTMSAVVALTVPREATKRSISNNLIKFYYRDISVEEIVTTDMVDFYYGTVTTRTNENYLGSVSAASGTAVFVYDTKNKKVPSGENQTITAVYVGGPDLGDSVTSGAITVQKKQITISGASIDSKVYDGTKAASAGAVTFNGLEDGDVASPAAYTINANFADKNAGTSKAVTGSVVLVSEGFLDQWYQLESGQLPANITSTITQKALTSSMIQPIAAQVYTGKPIIPIPTPSAIDIEVDGVSILQPKDYKVTYENNSKVGTGSAIFTAESNGNYSGSVTGYFAIAKAESEVKVKTDKPDGVYSYGDTIKFDVIITPTTQAAISTRSRMAAREDENLGTVSFYLGTETTENLLGTASGSAIQTATEGALTATWEYDSASKKISAVSGQTITAVYSGNDNLGVGEGTTTVTLNKKEITVSGAAIKTKIYDGTTAATVTSVTFGAIEPEDTSYTITEDYKVEDAQFENANAGDSKTVTGTAVLVETGKLYKWYQFSSGEFPTDVKGSITKKALANTMIADIADQVYTGKPITPASITVTDKNGSLEIIQASDYTISCSDNIKVGTGAAVTITATESGNYSGSAIKNFTIKKAQSDVTVTTNKAENTFTYGDNITFTVDITPTTEAAVSLRSRRAARENTLGSVNFYLESSEGILLQTVSAAVSGAGLTATWEYDSASKNIPAVSGQSIVAVYEGDQNLDKGTGNVLVNLNKKGVTVSGAAIESKTYDGTTAATVKSVTFGGIETGDTYEVRTDYTVTDAAFENANAGENKTVTGTAVFISGKTLDLWYQLTDATFSVNSGKITPKSLESNMIASITDQVYTGKEIEPKLAVSYAGMTLTENIDYVVAYIDNINVGTAKATITPATGSGVSENYSGSAEATFNITKATPTITLNAGGSYTYGDEVKATAKVSVSGEAIAVSEGAIKLYVVKDNGEIPLNYVSVTTATNGAILLTYDTANQQIKVGKNNLIVKLEENTNLSAASGSAIVELKEKTLTVSGVAIKTKVFDRETTAEVTAVTFGGIVSGNAVTINDCNSITANFVDANAGKDKKVTGPALSLKTGDDKSKWYVVTGGAFETTGEITAKAITSDMIDNIPSQPYKDGGVTPPVTVTYKDVKLKNSEYSVTYENNTKVGTGTAIVAATGSPCNFKTNTPEAARKDFTITKVQPSIELTYDKSYTYGDEVKVTAKVQSASGEALTVSGSSMTLSIGETELATVPMPATNGAILTYTSGKQIPIGTGTALTVKFAGDANLEKAEATATVSLEQKTLTVSGAAIETKVFDRNTVATVTAVTFGGIVSGDAITIANCTSVTANFADANVGEDKTVTGTAILQADTEWYTLPDGTFDNAKGEITQREITSDMISEIPSQTYTGSEIKPKVTVTYAGEDLKTTEYSVTYQNNTKVGTGTAIITAATGSACNFKDAAKKAEKDFTIAKVTPVIVLETESSYTYGDEVKVTATVKTSATGSALTVSGGPISLYAVDENGGESIALVSETITATSGAILAYNTFSKLIPEGTSTLKVRFAGDANLAPADETIEVTLEKKELTVSGASIAVKTYDRTTTATATAITFKDVVSGDAIKATDYKVTAANFKDANAGDKKVVTGTAILTEGTEMFKWYQLTDGLITSSGTIEKRELESDMISEIPSQTYTGSEIKPDITVTYQDVKLTTSEYSVTYQNNTKVGTGTAIITAATGSSCNFKDAATKAKKDFTIAQVTPVIVLETESSYTYGDTVKVTTKVETASGAALEVVTGSTMKLDLVNADNGETFLANVSMSAIGETILTYNTTGKTIPTGVQTLKVTFGGDKNLAEAATTASITLNQKGVTVKTAKVDEKVYDGTSAATATAIEFNGVVSGEAFAVTDYKTIATFSAIDVSTGAAATVTAKMNDTTLGKFYVVTGAAFSTTSKITEAPLTATPESNQGKYYGEEDSELTFTCKGQMTGETPAFTGTLERVSGSAIGTYAITGGSLTLKDNSPFKKTNYQLTVVSGVSFEIKEYEPGVDASLADTNIGVDDWYKDSVIVQAPIGFQISTGTAIGANFTENFTYSTETPATGTAITYALQSVSTGAISVAKSITVKVDQTTPTGKIEIEGHDFWDSLLSTITFGIYKPTKTEVTITGADTPSGVETIEYWITEGIYANAEDLATAAEGKWKTYGSKPSLKDNSKNVVYAKITDKAGQIFYLSSDGIVVDLMKPELTVIPTGFTDGEWFSEEDATIAVEAMDVNLATVSYEIASQGAILVTSGGSMIATGGSIVATGSSVSASHAAFSIPLTKDGEYSVTVTAVDQAGNAAPKTIRVKRDTNEPVFTVDTNGYEYDAETPTEEDVTFTMVPASGSAISGVTYQYAVGTGSSLVWKSFHPATGTSLTITETGKETYQFKAIAETGKEYVLDTPYSVNILKATYTPVIVEGYDGNWTNKDVTFTLSGGLIEEQKDYIAGYQWIKANSTPSSIGWDSCTGTDNNIKGVSAPAITVTDTYWFRVELTSGATGDWVKGGVSSPSAIRFDLTMPTGAVSAAGISWNDYTDPLKFETYTNRTAVTIIGQDVQSEDAVTKEFILTDKVYSSTKKLEQELGSEWKDYETETPVLSETSDNVVYVKITDEAGNASYIRSNGIIVDTKNPAIETTLKGFEIGQWSKGPASIDVKVVDRKVTKMTYQVASGSVITSPDESFTIDLPLDGTYDVVITAVDAVGNEASKTISVKLDKVSPKFNVSDGVYENDSNVPKVTDVTFTITPDSAALNNPSGTTYSYSTDGRTWTAISGTSFTVSGNVKAEYRFKATTGAGKTEQLTETFPINILKPEPTEVKVTAKVDDGANYDGGWLKGDKSVSFTVSGGEKQAQYIDSYEWTTTTDNTEPASGAAWTTCDGTNKNGYVAKGNDKTSDQYYWFRAKLTSHTTTELSSGTRVRFDATLPTGTITMTIGSEEKNWTDFTGKDEIAFDLYTKSKDNIKITGVDTNSDVKSIEYAVVNQAYTPSTIPADSWKTYSVSSIPTLLLNSKNVVYARVTDTVGNVCYLSSQGVVEDEAAPIIDVTGLTNGEWSHVSGSSIGVTVREDYLSNAKYQIGSNTEVNQQENKTFTISLTENGTYDVTITATDQAGNETIKIVPVKLDTIMPEFMVSTDYADTGVPQIITGVAFTILPTEGTKNNPSKTTYYYRKDSGKWIPLEENLVLTVTGTQKAEYTFRALTGAGNEKESSKYPVNILTPEYTSVVVDTNGYNGNWLAGNESVTFTISGGLVDTQKTYIDTYQWIATTENTAPASNADWKNCTDKNTLVVSGGSITSNQYYWFRAKLTSDTTTDITKGTQVKFDVTAPTGKIEIGTDSAWAWESFNSDIKFNLYTKSQSSVKITGTDVNSGTKSVEYLLSESAYTLEELKTLAQNKWTAYDTEKKPVLNQNKKNIVYAKVTDTVGNVCYLSSQGVVEDETVPVIDVTGFVDGNWSASAASITVAITEEYLSNAKYQIGTKQEVNQQESKDFTISLTDNGSYDVVITAEDKAGNVTTKTVPVKLDTVVPDFTVSTNGYTNIPGTPQAVSGVVFTITPTEAAKDNASGTKYYYKKDAGEWTLLDKPSLTVTGTVNATFTFKATTGAGKEKESAPYPVNILSAEYTPIAVDVKGYDGSWLKGDDSRTFTVSGGLSGTQVAYLEEYQWIATAAKEKPAADNSNWASCTGTGKNELVIAGGNHTSENYYWFRAKLTSGSMTEMTETGIQVKFDADKPTGKITVGATSWEKFLENITFGIYTRAQDTVTIAGGDVNSGVKTVEYWISDKIYTETTLVDAAQWTSYNDASKPTLKLNSKNVVYAKVTDTVGNIFYLSSQGIVEDEIAPVITATNNGFTEGEFSNVSDAAIGVTINEEYLKEASYQIGKNAPVYPESKNAFTVALTENGIYDVVISAKDEAGNIAASKTISVKLDRTTPEFDVSIGDYVNNPTTPQEKDVIFTLTPKDSAKNNISGTTYFYSTDNKVTWTKLDEMTLTVRGTVNKEYFFKATTGAGKEVISSSFPVNILKPEYSMVNVNANGYDSSWKSGTGAVRFNLSGGLAQENYIAEYQWTATDTNVKPAEDAVWAACTGEGKNELTVSGENQTVEKYYWFRVKTTSGNTGAMSGSTQVRFDAKKPAGEIEIAGTRWDQFLNVITFGIYTRTQDTIYITGTDEHSGVEKVQYFITDTSCATEQSLEIAADWKDYNSVTKPKLPVNSNSIVYAKVMDKVGNLFYLSSNGVVEDETNPAITITRNGFEDGKWINKTSSRIEVKVEDKNLETVTYQIKEEAPVTPSNQKDFAIELRDDGEYNVAITARDKAGNQTVEIVAIKRDVKAPVGSITTPVGTGVSISNDGNVILQWDEQISAVAGKCVIFSGGNKTYQAEVNKKHIIGLGDSWNVVIPYTDFGIGSKLLPNTVYSLSVEEGAFVDKAGNETPAIASNFTTVAVENYRVEYYYSGNGTLTAEKEDGTKILSGYPVEKNTKVIFTAKPDAGWLISAFMVKSGDDLTTIIPENGIYEINATADMQISVVYKAEALRGTVEITGTPAFGEKLTASISETNNTGDLMYKWVRGEETISAGKEYTLSKADIGSILTVIVTSTVQTGSQSKSTEAVRKQPYKGAAPITPEVLDRTYESIILKGIEGYEYSLGGAKWQSSNVFGGLSAGSSWVFYQRIAATETMEASPVSERIIASTTGGGNSGGGNDGGGSSGGSSGSGGGGSVISPTKEPGSETTNPDGSKESTSTGSVVDSKGETEADITIKTVTDKDGKTESVKGTVTITNPEVTKNNNTANIELKLTEEMLKKAESMNKTDVLASLDITIPKNVIIDSLNDKTAANGVNVKVTVPDSIYTSNKVTLGDLILVKEILSEGKKVSKDIDVVLVNPEGNVSYSWSFDGEKLKATGRTLTDVKLNISLKEVNTLDDEEKIIRNVVNKDKNNRAGKVVKGLVFDFRHSGLLPVSAEVQIYVGTKEEAGIKPGSTVYLYYYNSKTKKLEKLPDNKYQVDKGGYVTVSITHCSDYVLLPNQAASTIAVELLSQVTVKPAKTTLKKGSSTTYKVTLPSTLKKVTAFSKTSTDKAVEEVKFTYKSSNAAIASVSSTGKITGKKPGKVVITVTAQLASGTKKTYKATITVK